MTRRIFPCLALAAALCNTACSSKQPSGSVSKPHGDATHFRTQDSGVVHPPWDHTGFESNICEVHHVAMSKRTVPIGYGMIPMHDSEDGGAFAHRIKYYPHPGDCEPFTDLNLNGDEHAVVYVCPQCEAAMKAEKEER